MDTQVFKALLAAYLLSLLTGCADLKPVATFGAGASALATAYTPFVDDMEKTCLTRQAEQDVPAMGPFDYRAASEAAKPKCQNISDNKETIQQFAVVVDGYGAGLVELAGLKSDALSADISTLLDTAGKLKDKAGTALIDKNKVDMASKLATAAVELILGHKIKEEARKVLRDGHEPLKSTVTSMKYFVTSTYTDELEELERNYKRMQAELVLGSNADQVIGNEEASKANLRRAIPLRVLQVRYRERLHALETQKDLIPKFGEACDALVAAHAELIEKFDEKTAIDKKKALMDFIKKARDIRDAVQKL